MLSLLLLQRTTLNSYSLRETLSEINKELEHVLTIIRQGPRNINHSPYLSSTSGTTYSSPLSSPASHSSRHHPPSHHSHQHYHRSRHHRRPSSSSAATGYHQQSPSSAPNHYHSHSHGYHSHQHPRYQPNVTYSQRRPIHSAPYNTYPPPTDGLEPYSTLSFPQSQPANNSYQTSISHWSGERTAAIDALQRHSSWLKSLKDKIDLELTKNSSLGHHSPHHSYRYNSPLYNKHAGGLL